MNGLKRSLIPVVLLALASSAAVSYALPQFDAARMAKNLDRISFANRITGYQTVDAKHLVLVADERMNYLLSLKNRCHELKFARHIGVSHSNNTIYAGFDYVLADGQECAIERIQAISPEMARRLKI